MTAPAASFGRRPGFFRRSRQGNENGPEPRAEVRSTAPLRPGRRGGGGGGAVVRRPAGVGGADAAGVRGAGGQAGVTEGDRPRRDDSDLGPVDAGGAALDLVAGGGEVAEPAQVDPAVRGGDGPQVGRRRISPMRIVTRAMPWSVPRACSLSQWDSSRYSPFRSKVRGTRFSPTFDPPLAHLTSDTGPGAGTRSLGVGQGARHPDRPRLARICWRTRAAAGLRRLGRLQTGSGGTPLTLDVVPHAAGRVTGREVPGG